MPTNASPNRHGHTRRACLLVFIGVCMGSCHADSADNNRQARDITSYPVAQLYTGSQCGYQARAAVRRITKRADFDKAWQAISRPSLGRRTDMPDIDFSTQQVLLIQMGEQTSAGYALALHRNTAQLHQRELSLELNWLTPLPGQLSASVMSYPCLLLRLPSLEFDTLRVMDANRQLRLLQKFR